MSDHEQAEHLAELVEAALELPPEERAAFTRGACADNAALREQVEALLRRQNQVDTFMETPVFRLDSTAWPGGPDDLDSSNDQGWREGERVGDYVIGPLLGEGGMGEVYLAEDRSLGRQVAIKVVRQGLRTGRGLRHFRHEGRILAALNHPGIARLYGSLAAPDGTPCFVMEYVAGERLDVYCHRRRLALEERLVLFRKICAAVAYAHQNLVVHRDLKPANIRVTAEGEPKLLDFGIAKLLDASALPPGVDPTITLPGIMTPDYASPEQARGEIITTASDVYSLGVVLYELLSGQRPYRVATRLPGEVARAVCESVPERLSTAATRAGADPPAAWQRRLAGDLDNIVAMALRKEPARRYASVAQFSDDVRRYLARRPVLARPDTFRYRAGKFVLRNKAGVTAAALVLLALTAGLLVATWQARAARRQRDRAERRFADVRRLSGALLFDIAPKMERLAGSTGARQALVQRAQEYLDSLADETGGDPALRAELATAYIKVGELRGDPLRPNLGDFTGAVASYEKAVGILRELLARQPDAPGLLSSYGAALKDLSFVREWSGNTRGALADIQAAGAVYERLLRLVPGSTHERAQAAEVLVQTAWRHYLDDELPKVYPPLHAAIGTLEALRQTGADDPEILGLLGRARTVLGISLSWDGQQTEGEAEMARAFAIMEALVAAHPQDGVLRQGLLSTYDQGSQLYEEVDDPRAYDTLLKARELAEQALREDPANVQAQQNLAKTLLRLGTVALRLHHADSAVEALGRAEAILTNLEQNPHGARSYQIDLGQVNAALGEAWAEQGKFSEALTSFHRSIGLYETIGQADPANRMPIRKLANVYTYLGNSQRALARSLDGEARAAGERAAAESFRRALEQYAQLEARQPMTPYDQARRQEVQRALDEVNAR